MKTLKELYDLQDLPLERKVQVSQARILEWIDRWEGQVCVSFSGGIDSTVMTDMIARVWSANKELGRDYGELELIFINTGLEYPETRQFSKEFVEYIKEAYNISAKLTILWGEHNIKETITKYGYPVINKDISNIVYYARQGSSWAVNTMNGLNKDGSPSTFKEEHYKPYNWLCEAPFVISDKCCKVMKESLFEKYQRSIGKHPFIGTMASESTRRRNSWLKTGCNSFDSKTPKSMPIGFWKQDDVLMYLKSTGIPYCKLYGDIVPYRDHRSRDRLKTTGVKRTGCMFCAFGAHRDSSPTRFEKLKISHPKVYNFCINGGQEDENGNWTPSKEGLGMGRILDYLNIKY